MLQNSHLICIPDPWTILGLFEVILYKKIHDGKLISWSRWHTNEPNSVFEPCVALFTFSKVSLLIKIMTTLILGKENHHLYVNLMACHLSVQHLRIRCNFLLSNSIVSISLTPYFIMVCLFIASYESTRTFYYNELVQSNRDKL